MMEHLVDLGFAKMLIIELVFEACVCNLGEHALLYKDGEDAHGLFEKSHSVASKRSIQLANNSFYSNCLLNEFNAASQVHTKFNELPCNAFFLALLLLQHKQVVVEELLQFLICEVNAKLLQAVELKIQHSQVFTSDCCF